ncbi:hypothetical protein Tco_0945577 [Tanacetum coccineum]
MYNLGVMNSRTKQINIRYHFIKERVELGTIKLYFVGKEYQLADLFTKSLPKERIVGQIMIDHALSYALTATVDVPAVYIQQFWKSVKQVPNANDTIHLTIDRETITYTMDMFHDTLKLPVETPDNPFIKPAYLKFIQRFLKIVSYKGIVDKVSTFYTKNLAQPWQTMFKKKDVIQYHHFAKLIIADLMKRGMLIPGEFLTDDIRATMEYKEYEKLLRRRGENKLLEKQTRLENLLRNTLHLRKSRGNPCVSILHVTSSRLALAICPNATSDAMWPTQVVTCGFHVADRYEVEVRGGSTRWQVGWPMGGRHVYTVLRDDMLSERVI